MLDIFSFIGFPQIYRNKKAHCPTAEIIGIYFLRTIVPRKYMAIISAVGLFCCDFEETPNEKMSNMSNLTKSNFRYSSQCFYHFSPKILDYHVILLNVLWRKYCLVFTTDPITLTSCVNKKLSWFSLKTIFNYHFKRGWWNLEINTKHFKSVPWILVNCPSS